MMLPHEYCRIFNAAAAVVPDVLAFNFSSRKTEIYFYVKHESLKNLFYGVV